MSRISKIFSNINLKISSFIESRLEVYETADFETKQKVKLFYPICISGILTLILLIVSSTYVQLNNIDKNINPIILISELTLLVIFIGCLHLLIKKHYQLASHIFLLSATVCAWIIIFLGESDIFTRADTVVLLFAVLNTVPLFISKKKASIFIFAIFNILMVILFAFRLQHEFGINKAQLIDFIMDTSLAFLFSGIAGYHILKLNEKVLNKVEADYNERLKVEMELTKSELRYQNLVENAHIGIYRTSPKGEILEANLALIRMLGFESLEDLNSRNLQAEDVFVDSDRDQFIELMEKQGYVRGYEVAWKTKDGGVIIIKENSRAVKDKKGNIEFYEGFIENITERKAIEKALEQSEEKYRLLMENMNDIVMLVDNDDKVLYVNKRFTEKLGYTDSEIIGEIGYKKLIDSKDQEKIKQANKDRTKYQVSQYEAVFIAKDGTKYNFLVSGAPVKNDKGEVIGSIGNMVDITERKIAEEKLKKSQQLFQTLAMVSPVGIFRTRADGYTTYVNPKWSEISGLSFEQAKGDGWLKAVHPDDKKILDTNWKLHSKKGEESIAEYRFVKKNGSVAWVLGNAVPEIIDGEIQGYIGTITDITERKIIEEKIKESEEKYRTIIEAFQDIIMISDFDRNILYANDSLEKFTGITPEDYRNKNRKAKIHPEDLGQVQDAMKELLNGEKKHTDIIEHRFIDAWGNEKWFAGTMSKMTYNGKPVIQTITRDITEKKNVEQELAKYREHLEFLVKERTEELEATNEELTSTNEELHSQREELQVTLKNLQKAQKQLIQAEKMASLGVLASGVAHEINNPLNFIRGGAFGLEDYLTENLPDHLENLKIFIGSINEGVDRAASIVTSLNHYSHRDESKITECNIHDIIDNCLNILRNQLSDIIHIEKNYTNSAYMIKCNEGKMHQAILNILTNSIQAIDGKGEIKIKTSSKNNNLQIHIADSGCGISEENLVRIFDPFFTTKDPGKGTGLGLAITYNIVEEHNGKIEINSELYSGTTVIITLPVINK